MVPQTRPKTKHPPRRILSGGYNEAMDAQCLEKLRGLIAGFPKSPGVYLMKDAEGRVLYVG